MISQEHAAHIGKVEVSLDIESITLTPEEITQALTIRPTDAVAMGSLRERNGQILGVRRTTLWFVSTEGIVLSKDINDHFEYLANYFGKSIGLIKTLDLCMPPCINVLWTSSYLYAGTGPLISAKSCEFIVHTGASLGFDIYAIDDDLNVRDSCASCIEKVLQTRFGHISEDIKSMLSGMIGDDTIDNLNLLFKKAISVTSLKKFEKLLASFRQQKRVNDAK